MNRLLLNLLFGAATTVAALYAENPLSDDVKGAYQRIESNILKAAEKMPDAEYAWKPTPDVRTFGQLVAHVAEAQAAICGIAKGGTKRGDAAPVTSKADLLAALKASNDVCDGVYTSFRDAEGAEILKTPFGPKPKLGVLAFNVMHDNETYGTMVVYLRLKGIVPPSSEGK
jgi:hypothetical protein